MQDIVNHHIRNEISFYRLYRVTCFCIGNYPANGLVTEILQ